MSYINIRDMDLATFNEKYRFSFTEKFTNLDIKSAIYIPTASEENMMASLSLDEFNGYLRENEDLKEKSAMLLTYKNQPKEIRELLSKVNNGKYNNLVKRNSDGIVFGRNLEKSGTQGNFTEDLVASAMNEVSVAIDKNSSKDVMIDSYNNVFNSLSSKTAADKAYTKFAQILSVYSNEIKGAYNISRGKVAEDEKVYTYLDNVFADLQKHLDEGGTFSFVKSSEKTVFQEAVTSMKSNLDAYVKTFDKSGNIAVSFKGIA